MEDGKDIPRLFSFAFLPCAMINPQWLELPMPRTNFHGTKDVRATEVRLYFVSFICGILAFILSLLVPCSSLVCCLKKAVLIDCGISSVSSYTCIYVFAKMNIWRDIPYFHVFLQESG